MLVLFGRVQVALRSSVEAILGVVIGWILAVARELLAWLWRRRESARGERAAVRRTARLISADLTSAERQLRGILVGTILWQEVGFDIRSWRGARDSLVDAVTKPEWDAVVAAHNCLDELNGMTAHRSDVDAPRLRSASERALPVVHGAVQALARLSG